MVRLLLLVSLPLAPIASAAEGGDERIVGGHPAEPGDWPDAAAIWFGLGDVGCTGTLIAPDLVLTAGHCLPGVTHVTVDAVDYRHSQGGELIAVSWEIEYPQSQRTYDVAVLVLEAEASVAPRPIATGCVIEQHLYDGAEVAIVGYGALDQWGTTYGTELMEAFTVVTDHDCSDLGGGCQSSVSPNGELGAGGDGTDTCYGDSGGPLYLLTPHGSYLAGITSRAWSWVDAPCRDGGIYVRPDAIIEWIEEETGRILPRATCNQAPEPKADVLEVRKNGSGSVRIRPHDPDEADQHSFEIVEGPEHGEATVTATGELHFTASGGYTGDDAVVVRVTDDADEPADAELEVAVRVLTGREWREANGGCGCSSGAGLGAPWLLAALLLAARRRRTRRAG